SLTRQSPKRVATTCHSTSFGCRADTTRPQSCRGKRSTHGRLRRSSGNNSSRSQSSVLYHFPFVIYHFEDLRHPKKMTNDKWKMIYDRWIGYLASGNTGSISTGTSFNLSSACFIGGL